VLIALSLRNSFLTLPFGLALFFLKGAAPPAVALRDIYLGIGGPSSRRAKAPHKCDHQIVACAV
jgi:hypothetical protein